MVLDEADEVDVVMLEASFSIVCAEKYGSEKPCNRINQR